MDANEPVGGIQPLYPSGTNSTFFTECCGSAICDDQQRCPVCGMLIIGWDARLGGERNAVRWRHAYKGNRRTR